jgi:hypothetical protein
MDKHSNITDVNFIHFKGLSNYLESNRTNIEYCYEAKNCIFDRGKIISSPGHDAFLSELTNGTDYKLLNRYEYTTGGVSTELLTAVYNKEVYNIDLSTNIRTALSASLGTDEEGDSVQFVNKLYIVSPTNGGGEVSGNTYTARPTIPKGRMIESAWQKIWVSGVDGNEATVYGSATALATDLTKAYDFATGETELVGKGGKNTAMRFLNDTLYIFKKDSIHFIKPNLEDTSVLYIPKPFAVTGGAINQKSTIVVENDIWFLTSDLEVRSLGAEQNFLAQNRTRDLTSVIQNIKNELSTDQENVARATYHDGIYKIALATKGSSIANIIIIYNTVNNSFSVERFPSVKQWAVANNRTFLATTGSGQLYQDNAGYTFGGFEIPFKVTTVFSDFQRPDRNYRARRLVIRGKRSKGLALSFKLYYGDYSHYDTFTIAAPDATEIGETTPAAGTFGAVQIGNAPFGGASSAVPSDEPGVYKFEKIISASRVSDMFALGVECALLGQKLEIEQFIVGILPSSTKLYNI